MREMNPSRRLIMPAGVMGASSIGMLRVHVATAQLESDPHGVHRSLRASRSRPSEWLLTGRDPAPVAFSGPRSRRAITAPPHRSAFARRLRRRGYFRPGTDANFRRLSSDKLRAIL